MFEHLVESGSHSEDLKRKGSFLLGFAGLYVVLIIAFGIAGIMWATANIDAQTLELTALIAPVAPGNGTGNIIAGPAKVDVADAPPPPPPKPTPPKAPISGGVLNGKAVRLVQPPYPAIARSAHASGQVRVQITIDENGNVVSAAAVSGHPLLQGAAVAAARQSKFTPTKLSGMPVKVTGVIIYNFVAQ